MSQTVGDRAVVSDALRERYAAVRERIAAAAKRSGRRPEDVLLVAVGKYADVGDVFQLAKLGHKDFGENTVQQLAQRAAMLDELFERDRVLERTRSERGISEAGSTASSGIRWHLIGHLQRNKVKRALELSRLIHSVDTLRLAEEIQQIAMKKNQVVEVLLQVNCSEEESKFGCPLPAAACLAEQIDSMIEIRLRGLMTMGPLTDDPNESRAVFERCRDLFDEIRKMGVGEGRFDILSMGMSSDFEVAIECGANVVRVGSAIFGDRQGNEPAESQD